MKILVTGTAGFIGFHVAKFLLERGDEVLGLDNLNDYYDVELKYGRLKECGINNSSQELSYNEIYKSIKYPRYRFVRLDLNDRANILKLIEAEKKIDAVCHLAAQAGVRYSLSNPYAYIDSNIVGFINILEGIRQNNIINFSFASSSSVYGLNENMPFSTHDNVDHPISLYAASKKSNELMAHTYSYIYRISATGLRFFTVYGPWGRPDMALFKFVKNIIDDKPIDVYNYGNMSRDFTYIDDIVEGVVRVIDNPAQSDKKWTGKNPNPSRSKVAFRLYNLGNGSPVPLMDFIEAIEEVLEKKAKKNMLPMQPGEVQATFADTKDLEEELGYKPCTDIKQGIDRFVEWYLDFYKSN